jgi:DNA-binding FadR family transcriptional regulator
MLRILGVTESRQGGRYYVTDLSTSGLIKPVHRLLQDYDVATHLEARAAVDFALVRMACERATDEEIQRLQFPGV